MNNVTYMIHITTLYTSCYKYTAADQRYTKKISNFEGKLKSVNTNYNTSHRVAFYLLSKAFIYF